MNHMILGAAAPYLISALIYFRRGARASLRMLIVAPLAIGACAVWAVVPDIPRALGFNGLYGRLHKPIGNVFFFHHSIDKVESDSTWYAPAFLLLGLSIVFVAWRELRMTESERHRAEN